MISSDIIRGCVDTIILCTLTEGSSYGYEISKRIRDMSEGNYVIKETTLYSALTRLEKNGFIISSRSEHDGRTRTYYSMTAAGRTYYAEKCGEWKLTKDIIDRFIKE